jgi:hypothetical protein
MNKASDPDRAAAYELLVDSMLDRVHRHVRLVYPFAPTHATVVATFRHALSGRRPNGAPGDRAWLYGLARNAVHDDAGDPGEFDRLNAAAVVFGVREIAESLTGEAQTQALASVDALASLPSTDQHVLRLRTIERDLQWEEFAWILGVERADAEKAFATAHERLRAAFDPASGHSAGDCHDE